MINLSESEKIVKMKVEISIPQSEIFEFLQKNGYEIKSWLWQYEDETFPNGVTLHENWTFTATKNDELQSEKTLYLTVFEREMKGLLKQIN